MNDFVMTSCDNTLKRIAAFQNDKRSTDERERRIEEKRSNVVHEVKGRVLRPKQTNERTKERRKERLLDCLCYAR